MLGNLFIMAATGVVLLAGLGLLSTGVSRVDNELCWSCGQRASHKLWCPNR
jgi:hypothetical protein